MDLVKKKMNQLRRRGSNSDTQSSSDGSTSPEKQVTSSKPKLVDMFAPSAPKFQGTSQSVLKSRWTVTARLRVCTDISLTAWVDMERILEVIMDQYDGNAVFRTPIFIIYWIAGHYLHEVPGPVNRFCWSTDFGDPMIIEHTIPLLGSQSFDYSFNTRGAIRGCIYNLEFSCSFVPTKRRTSSILEVISAGRTTLCAIRPLSHILKDAGIESHREGDRLIFSTSN